MESNVMQLLPYREGTEYILSVDKFNMMLSSEYRRTGEFAAALEYSAHTWGYQGEGQTSIISPAEVSVDYGSKTITISGRIPGITYGSHISAYTNFGPISDGPLESICAFTIISLKGRFPFKNRSLFKKRKSPPRRDCLATILSPSLPLMRRAGNSPRPS